MRRVLNLQFPDLKRKSALGLLMIAGRRGLRTCVRRVSAKEWQLTTLFLALAAFGSLAQAQQIDLAANGSILWSPKANNASQAFIPPPEKGGVFGGASLQYLRPSRFGLNVEGAFRAKEGLYNGYQYYRPILYDVNGVYARRLGPKTRGDFMAGIGGETLLFYQQTVPCRYNGGCRTYVNDNHFLVHAGFGVRYYFWRAFFAKPEVHYYLIPNNFEFHSDHVFRLGVSVGHTFGGR